MMSTADIEAPLCLPRRQLARLPRPALRQGTVDTHFHVFRADAPLNTPRSYTPDIATIADWIEFSENLGIAKGVLVQPSVYGLDNSVLLEALAAFPGRLRGIVVIDPETGETEIERLHHEMYGHYLRRDLHGYFACNQAIHDRIVAAAGNGPLSATYAGFAGRLRRARYSANLDANRDRWGEAMREHEEILDALRRRAGAELSDILFRHLRNKRKAAADREAAQPISGGPATADIE